MKVSIIGTGRIGKTEGKLLARTGHEVMFGTRNLIDTRFESDTEFMIGTIPMAAQFAEVILLAMPWVALEETKNKMTDLGGKIIIDATNPFGRTKDGFGVQTMPDGMTALQYTMKFFPECKVVKSFNILTAGFQLESAGRTGPNRVVMPLAGDDLDAKIVVSSLINDMGFTPFDVGDASKSKFIEPPRCSHSLYGEEWHLDTVGIALDNLKQGLPYTG